MGFIESITQTRCIMPTRCIGEEKVPQFLTPITSYLEQLGCEKLGTRSFRFRDKDSNTNLIFRRMYQNHWDVEDGITEETIWTDYLRDPYEVISLLIKYGNNISE